MTKKGKYRRCIAIMFWSGIIFTIAFIYYYMEKTIPDQINIVAEEQQIFKIDLPIHTTIISDSEEVVLGNGSNIPGNEIKLSSNENFSIYSKNQGHFKLGLRLFGLIQFKEIQVDVVDSKYVVPCGTPIGIYLKSDGIMVIGTGKVTNIDGQEAEPALGILKSGDYIEAINGEILENKEDLISLVNKGNGEAVVLNVRRNGENIDVKMIPEPVQDGTYKLGAWVRDDTQGIGTMTYVDMNGHFGALGHGISDSDTGEVVQITEGELYETKILGIEKGSAGKPGVMSGVIYYGPGSNLGDITANTVEGIFGTTNEQFKKNLKSQAIEVGYHQDITRGKAYIRSCISGEAKDYEIEIQQIDYSAMQRNKGLVIKVTDPELLELTGGIVQGMSGSPIIQNGKLIGAVTHVFVQDSTRGYGIFIENMLEH